MTASATRQWLDETGVDIDRKHRGAATGHPIDQRAAARTNVQASPAGTDAQPVQQPRAARIPQTFHARQSSPLLGETLVIAVVTRHGSRLWRSGGGNPAKTVEGGGFSH